jgi:hypothetical protein
MAWTAAAMLLQHNSKQWQGALMQIATWYQLGTPMLLTALHPWYVGHLGGYGSSVKCCMMFNVQFSHVF